MSGNSSGDAIFVHASPRSGSTYFFNVLRRVERLLCFDEAITDAFTDFGKNDLARRIIQRRRNTSHLFLDSYSQTEFLDAWNEVMHLYPPAPAFRDYVPRNGVLPDALRVYLAALINYAGSKRKRAALCDIFSRGRAGALRHAFGGFHIAQFRDPLSQFGSCFRALQESGSWTFLIVPLQELGLSGENALHSLVPDAWRVPRLPWPADKRGQRWASTQTYVALIVSSEPRSLERVFRWHLLSWFLHNLMAVVHADFVLDIDRVYDDPDYRNRLSKMIKTIVGAIPDFSDLTKFARYYRFEGLDIVQICDEVVAVLDAAEESGALDRAVSALSVQKPIISPNDAYKMLRVKLAAALAQMQSATTTGFVSKADWDKTVLRHRSIWANKYLREAMRQIYPIAFPFVQATRRARGNF